MSGEDAAGIRIKKFRLEYLATQETQGMYATCAHSPAEIVGRLMFANVRVHIPDSEATISYVVHSPLQDESIARTQYYPLSLVRLFAGDPLPETHALLPLLPQAVVTAYLLRTVPDQGLEIRIEDIPTDPTKDFPRPEGIECILRYREGAEEIATSAERAIRGIYTRLVGLPGGKE